MAVASSVTVTGTATGLAGGTKTYGPVTISSTSPTDATAGSITTVTLASGANTITVPSTTTAGCIIQFDSTSTQTKTLKGITGDTGIAVAKTSTCVLTFDTSAPANFVITAGGADTGKTTTIWWF